MHLSTKAILSITTLSLLILPSSAIASPDEKKTKSKAKKRLRRNNRIDDNNIEEDILTPDNLVLNKLIVEEPPEEPSSTSSVMPVENYGGNETRSLSAAALRSEYDNKDITVYPGLWGGWKTWQKSDKGGMYACGANLRFEDHVGGGDDTAANGLKLQYCGLNDWYNQEEKTIYNGVWGGWKGWEMCPYGKYIGAANVRFEDWIGGGDDTALNGLAIWCVDENWYNGEMKIVYSGLWGEWKGWKYEVGKLVKGARVRFEDPIGIGDDTAMNGIQLNVEKPNYGVSHAPISGEWVSVTSGPQGYVTHKIIESTTTTSSKSLTKEEVYGFTQSISAGFKFKIFDASASVTASQSYRTAEVMEHSLQVYKGTETTLGCPSSGSPTGYYTMWQFKMHQSSDASGVGFLSETKHIRCTPSIAQPPRCSLGSCKDTFCQECIE